MSSRTELFEQVRQLIDAENNHDGGTAERILADNFAGITRSQKKDNEEQEQNRVELLRKIGQKPQGNKNSENSNPRQMDKQDYQIWESEGLGVVKSLVTRTNPKDQKVERFRNIHVFEKQQGKWRCVAWQVTRLE
jgi:hypothetical protein